MKKRDDYFQDWKIQAFNMPQINQPPLYYKYQSQNPQQVNWVAAYSSPPPAPLKSPDEALQVLLVVARFFLNKGQQVVHPETIAEAVSILESLSLQQSQQVYTTGQTTYTPTLTWSLGNMSMPKTVDDLMERLEKFLPDADLGEDEQGLIVVCTHLKNPPGTNQLLGEGEEPPPPTTPPGPNGYLLTTGLLMSDLAPPKTPKSKPAPVGGKKKKP